MSSDQQMENRAQPFVLSRNPEKAMQEMMETVDALRALYREENEALGAADIGRFARLQEKKLKIVGDYHQGASQIAARREEFKAVTPELRTQMAEAHDAFSRVAAENLRNLEKMRRSVQRLNDRIMSIAREAVRNDTPNYGAAGTLNRNQRRVPIGLNESA